MVTKRSWYFDNHTQYLEESRRRLTTESIEILNGLVILENRYSMTRVDEQNSRTHRSIMPETIVTFFKLRDNQNTWTIDKQLMIDNWWKTIDKRQLMIDNLPELKQDVPSLEHFLELV